VFPQGCAGSSTAMHRLIGGVPPADVSHSRSCVACGWDSCLLYAALMHHSCTCIVSRLSVVPGTHSSTAHQHTAGPCTCFTAGCQWHTHPRRGPRLAPRPALL
jgi:hypothetical protein